MPIGPEKFVWREFEAARVLVPRRVLVDALARLEDLHDEGPPDEGWQSDALAKLVLDVRAALTPPITKSP